MFSRIFTIAALLVCIAAPSGATPREAQAFIGAMLRGVGARSVPCPIEVVARTRPHAMNVVCARFDGDFPAFETRWSLHLRQDAILDDFDGSGPVPPTKSQTAWELRQGSHERIYTVGDVAVGVRFRRGEIVAVYK